MKLITVILFIAMMITIFGCSKTPNEAPYDHNSSLEGYVTFEEGSTDTLQANVKVFFQDDATLVAETLTLNSGYYLLENLISATYSLHITADSYSDFNVANIQLISNELTVIDTVDLEFVIAMETRTITIDGEIDDDWESSYINDHETNWGPNDFENLYISRDDEKIYLAVSGVFSDADNTVNIYIDKDYGNGTGVNDFSTISGGGYGDHLRKTVTTPESFGADLAFSGWSLSDDIGVVSLEEPGSVDQYLLENTEISVNTSVIEFSIPFNEIFEDGVIPTGGRIALVAVIGGGDDYNFANDTIPQQEDFTGTFITVFSRGY